MQARPHLSVIIPAYNEERRIGASLRSVAEHLARARGPAEVLVVDDGSKDGTAAAVERFAREATGAVTVRLLRNGRNRGKGYSIKHGVLMASGDYLLLTDADLSTPMEELPRLLRLVESEGCGIAFGSRGLAASRVEIHQPIWRETMGRCFNRLVRAITGLPFHDTQCGFKVMRREEVLPLFRAARVERFAYDVEILYLAGKAGIRAIEVPVIWRNSAASKVNALSDSFDMLKDVVRVVLRDRRGRYGALGSAAGPAREGR
jgi:glycosyltransferase involved in cell wall biosynthesis